MAQYYAFMTKDWMASHIDDWHIQEGNGRAGGGGHVSSIQPFNVEKSRLPFEWQREESNVVSAVISLGRQTWSEYRSQFPANCTFEDIEWLETNDAIRRQSEMRMRG